MREKEKKNYRIYTSEEFFESEVTAKSLSNILRHRSLSANNDNRRTLCVPPFFKRAAL